MVTAQAVRRWIMTGAVTAITITGAIYGAGLKSQQEYSKEKKRLVQATPDEILAQLEHARSDMMVKKNELERKLTNFRERRREKEQQSKEAK